MPGRSGKQVRERYINKLDPKIKKDPFTHDEDVVIYNAIQKIGKKWS
jgi:myb proto-oncogene protein